MSIEHATFTLERRYPQSPAQVFAAWRDPELKAKWFAPTADSYELDVRPGGRELLTARVGDEQLPVTFAATFHDVVDDERIVFASELGAGDGGVSTLAITTVEIAPDGEGTKLTLTEQDTFIDGWEKPEWREHGVNEQLDRLGETL